LLMKGVLPWLVKVAAADVSKGGDREPRLCDPHFFTTTT